MNSADEQAAAAAPAGEQPSSAAAAELEAGPSSAPAQGVEYPVLVLQRGPGGGLYLAGGDDHSEPEETGEESHLDEDGDEEESSEGMEEFEAESFDEDEFSFDEESDHEEIEFIDDDGLSQSSASAYDIQEDEVFQGEDPQRFSYVLPCPWGYPTMESSLQHHQAADALAVRTSRNGALPGEEVVMTRGCAVMAFHLRPHGPPAVPAQGESPGGAAAVQGRASLLGDALVAHDPYSIAFSPDGDFLAIAGSSGLVTLFSCHSDGLPGTAIATCAVGSHLAHTVDRHSMANCVRFGLVNGVLRMVVACQNGYVYLFSMPPPGAAEVAEPQSLAVKDFAGVHSMRRARLFVQQPVPFDVQWGMPVNDVGVLVDTAALQGHPEEKALNCAVPSPSGTHMAVAGDFKAVVVLPLAAPEPGAEAEPPLLLPFASGRHPFERVTPGYEHAPAGCQYVAWNSTGTLLAATTDAYRLVLVWRPFSGGALLLRLEHFVRPVLALAFHPSDPSLLAWSEEAKYVYLQDVERAGRAQRLLVPHAEADVPEEVPRCRRRINGLAFTPAGTSLLVASREQVVEWELVGQAWSPARHRHFPRAFRDAAAVLLMAAAIDPATGQPRHPNGMEVGLWSLPRELLLRVLECAARPIADWSIGAQLQAQP